MEEKAVDFMDWEQPTPDAIYELVKDGWKAHILRAAIHLNVFNTISEGLCTAKKIASSKGWMPRPTRVLLDSLCSLGFLTKKNGKYVLTPVSKAFLVSCNETYAGEWIATLAIDRWQQLANAVTTGEREILDACSSSFAACWKQDAAMEALQRSRIDESLEMWRTVGIGPDTKQKIKVLDLASGCGIKSLVLARYNHNAEITCLDWAGVLQVAEKLASKWGVLKQVSFEAGDLMETDYGESEFDAVLLGQITYYLSPDHNKFVLKKVYRALSPNGLVILHVPMADEERCQSEALITAVALLVLCEQAEIYTFSEYKSMLEESGFSHVTKHSESLISGKRL